MAIGVTGTVLATTTNATSYTTAAQANTTAGDLVLLFIIVTGDTTSTPTVTESLSETSFVSVPGTPVLKASSADRIYCFISTGFLKTTSATRTFTISGLVATPTGCIIQGYRIPGMLRTGLMAIRQVASEANKVAGTPAPTFSAAVLTGNPTFGVVGNATNPAGMTAPTSWTEDADTGYASPITGGETVSRSGGFTGTTVTWGSASASAFADIIIELDTTISVSAFDFEPANSSLRIPFMWMMGTMQFLCDLESLNWGWKPPTLATAQDDCQELFTPPQLRSYYIPEIEDEMFQWGLNIGALGGSGTGYMAFRGQWALRAGMDTEQPFMFNSVVVTAITPFDDDGSIPVVRWVMPNYDDDYLEQDIPFASDIEVVDIIIPIIIDDVDIFGCQPVFIGDEYAQPQIINYFQEIDSDQVITEGFTTDRVPEDFEQLVITNQLALYWNDDDASQSTFFSLEQFGEIQETPIPQQLGFNPDIEDEMYQWGFNLGAMGGGGMNLMSWRGYKIQPGGMGSDIDNWGFNTPTVTAISAFDTDELPVIKVFNVDDMEQVAQQPVFVQDFEQLVLTNQLPLYWTDDDASQSTFFASEQYSDNDLQMPLAIPNALGDNESEQFGFNFQQAFDIDNTPLPIVLVYDDADVFGFQTPVVTVVTAFAEDTFPINSFVIIDDVDIFGFQTQVQQSYDFDYMPLAQSLVTDNMDQQGNQPVFVQEESLQLTPQLFVYQDDDTFGFLVSQTFSESIDIPIPQQISFYIRGLENDNDSAQSTFFASEQYADIDEQFIPLVRFLWHEDDMVGITIPVVTSDELHLIQYNFTYQEEDQFGFKTAVVISVDDTDQFINIQRIIVDDAEQFSFQTPIVVATAFSFDATDQFSPIKLIMDDVETFGFNPTTAVLGTMSFDQDDLMFNKPWSLNMDDETQWGYAPIITGGSGTNMMGFRGFWSLPAGMGSEDAFGFQTPAVVTAFDQDELIPVTNIVYDDVVQFNYETVFVQDELINPTSVSVQYQEDAFGFQTPVVINVINGFDLTDYTPYRQFSAIIDDEEFNWGLNIGITGGSGTQMMGFRGYRIHPAAMGSDIDNYGFQPPMTQVQSEFDVEYQKSWFPYPIDFPEGNLILPFIEPTIFPVPFIKNLTSQLVYRFRVFTQPQYFEQIVIAKPQFGVKVFVQPQYVANVKVILKFGMKIVIKTGGL